jgi:hypothetical protein
VSGPRPITFLSDYGTEDEFAGVCRAVIARIAPEARVIDLTHGIARHDLRQGSAVLANALPFTAPGVHLAVIDPGVGTERRAVALALEEQERALVGPDNGLLWRAAERFGGVREAVDVSLSSARLEPVSATFHGRDLFAPVAARLALGTGLASLGEAIDPASLVRLARRAPEIDEGRRVRAAVAYGDRFGNAALDLSSTEAARAGIRAGAAVRIEAGGRTAEALYARTFADVPAGALVLHRDSYENLALAVNRASALELLGIAPGDEVVLAPG